MPLPYPIGNYVDRGFGHCTTRIATPLRANSNYKFILIERQSFENQLRFEFNVNRQLYALKSSKHNLRPSENFSDGLLYHSRFIPRARLPITQHFPPNATNHHKHQQINHAHNKASFPPLTQRSVARAKNYR